MPFPILALVLLALFTFLDREIGDGERGLLSRSKAMIAAVVAGGILGVIVFGHPAWAALGLAWAGWRSLTFFHGSGAPQSTSQALAAFARQALMVPIALLAYWSGGDAPALALFLLMAATVNTAFRMRYGHMVAKVRQSRDYDAHREVEAFNRTVELASGAAFGLALLAYAYWTSAGLSLF